MPTATPTLTATPTQTSTLTSTYTPTATEIPKVTEVMPTGKPFFNSYSDNLDGYTGGFDRAHQATAGYEFVEVGGNKILKATVMAPGDPVRAYPDIYFSPRPGNFYTKLKVGVSNLPSDLILRGIAQDSKPWLSIASVFDKGDPIYHASVMVKLEGTPDSLRVVTITRNESNRTYVAREEPDVPLFRNGAEIAVFVDVNKKIARTVQDGKLVSTGTYYGEPQLAGAHWLWYSAGNVTGEMTNDDVELGSW